MVTFFGNSRVAYLIRIVTISVALGICVMQLSGGVLNGFRSEIGHKVSGFMAELQISALGEDPTQPAKPFNCDSVLPIISNGVVTDWKMVHQRAVILRKSETISGIVLKGLGSSNDFDFIKSYLVAGSIPQTDTIGKSGGQIVEILMSDKLAAIFSAKVGDNIYGYFNIDGLKVRKVKIVGLFHTGIEDFDQTYAFCIKQRLDKLANFLPHEVTGLEWKGKDGIASNIDYINQLNLTLPQELEVRTNRELYPQIFDWLGLIDRNVWVINGVMGSVAVLSLIAILMVLVVEHTRRIGVLKTLGANNSLIFSVFYTLSLRIAFQGILIGNAMAFLIYFLQSQWHIFSLPEENYYISTIPIDLDWTWIVVLNICVILLIMITLLIPFRMIMRIRPTRILAFE